MAPRHRASPYDHDVTARQPNVVRSNSGAADGEPSLPGMAGYRPSAPNTYQADICPRSSLPGIHRGRIEEAPDRPFGLSPASSKAGRSS